MRNKMRAKEEESVYSSPYTNVSQVNKVAQKKPSPRGFIQQTKEDLKRKEEEKLAEFRKQQYWEMRRQAESNRKRVESELYEGVSMPNSDGPKISTMAQRQIMAEEKRREDRLLRLKNNYEEDNTKNNGYRSNIFKDHNNQFNHVKEDIMSNSILTTMKGVIGDIRNKSNDDDNIFSTEETVEEQKIKFKHLGQTLKLSGIGESDPLNCRVEALRKYLEESLSDEAFLRVYKLLRREDLDEDMIDNQIQKLMPPSKQSYLPLIYQLIFCEDRLNDHQLS